MKHLLALTAIAVMLGACAAPRTVQPGADSAAAELEAHKQRVLALQAQAHSTERLLRLGYPILVQAVDLCGQRTRPVTGMSLWNNAGHDNPWKAAAREAYDLDERLRVAVVVPDSPAARAGVQVGDLPLSISGWPVPAGDGAPEEYASKLRLLLAAGEPLDVRLRRGSVEMKLSLTPERACAFDLQLLPSDERNAFADGERIVLTTGILEFARDDDEAALIIAHELAHNAMGHVSAKQQNAIAGGIAGFLVDVAAAATGVNTQGAFSRIGADAGAVAYSVEFEQEADYVAVYLMARAGYRVERAPNFWRRMAIQDPRAITLRTTHPPSAERFVALENAVLEVKAKQSRGAPLLPELQPAPESTLPPAPDPAQMR